MLITRNVQWLPALAAVLVPLQVLADEPEPIVIRLVDARQVPVIEEPAGAPAEAPAEAGQNATRMHRAPPRLSRWLRRRRPVVLRAARMDVAERVPAVVPTGAAVVQTVRVFRGTFWPVVVTRWAISAATFTGRSAN